MAGCLLFVILLCFFYEIPIQGLPPTLTVNPPAIRETESITLNCQAPASVSVYQCHFYTRLKKRLRGFSCQRTLYGTDLLLLAHQSSPAVVPVNCYYTVKPEDVDSPSSHSETSFITINEIDTANLSTTISVTPVNKNLNKTSGDQITEMRIWTLIIVMTVFGVTVGIISLARAYLCTKGRSEDLMCKRNLDNGGLLPADNDNANSVITSVPGASGPTGSEKCNGWDPQNEHSDHVYSTISEDSSISAKEIIYSTVQAH